jgi:predicted nucleic acid-binding protein
VSIVFADTFYWVALANRNDASHQNATEFTQRSSSRLLTTEWVLTEVADGFASARHRNLVAQLRTLWRTDKTLMIAEATHDTFERGLDLFGNRADKDWSLTDCISFVVMQDHGLTEALTADHHFEQAGFVRLLK